MMNIRSAKDKVALALRLSRIEGQLRGIQRMIEADEECHQIAQQMSAARKALDRAFYQMIACMLEHDFSANSPRDPRLRQRVHQVAGILAKFA